MALLTHEEYKKIVDTTDAANADQFKKIENSKCDTYLVELIGEAMISKVSGGSYTELLGLIKNCLAYEIFIYFTSVGSVKTTAIGSVTRTSEFSEKADFAEKKLKIEKIKEILRVYEKSLLDKIKKGSYPEKKTQETALTTAFPLKITNIG